MQQLDPSRKNEFDKIIKPFLTEIHQSFLEIEKSDLLFWFALHAAAIRILDPSINISINSTKWKQMQELLDRNSMLHFGQLVGAMRILAAHQVEWTQKGLIITDTPPNKLDTTIPPRPVRKKI